MKQFLSNKILALFSVTITIVALFYAVKTNKLNQQIAVHKASQQKLQMEIDKYSDLFAVDSLLVAGEYQNAVFTTKERFVETKDWNNNGAALRIALAEKFIELQQGVEQTTQLNNEKEITDSLTLIETPSAKEVRHIDSLRFALEKCKIQIARLERQSAKKSLGQYLTFTSSKGSEIHYVGQVKNNRAHGNGIALFNTGSRYDGEWKNNQRHGKGAFYWPDGEYYIGEYENDMRDGQGTYYWSNGEKFVGLWEKDKRTGEGTFYDKQGKVITRGVWQGDELVQAHKP